MRVLVLSHDDVLAALPPAECAEAMAEVLAGHARGEAFMPLRSVMMPPGEAGFMGLMPGWRQGRERTKATFALKAICLMPGNPARGLDAHQGIMTLFAGETGVPTAILDASAVTEIRTAAVRTLAERVRVIAEGAGALALAAVLAGRAGPGKVVCIVSGGNINLATLSEILTAPRDAERPEGDEP
jgi:ornithine cyclodeaminase/alanine dehydrogenase-like protein (mu-crystallin family)